MFYGLTSVAASCYQLSHLSAVVCPDVAKIDYIFDEIAQIRISPRTYSSLLISCLIRPARLAIFKFAHLVFDPFCHVVS